MTKAMHSDDMQKPARKKLGFHKRKHVAGEEIKVKNSKFSPEKKKILKHNKNLKFKKNFKSMKSNDGVINFENNQIKKNSSNSGFKGMHKKFKKFNTDKISTVSAEDGTTISEKKPLKRKGEFEDPAAAKKHKIYNMKPKERKLYYKKNEQEEKFDVVKKLKMLWEELRRDDCEKEKKKKLLGQICGIISGHVKEFVFAHDTVRILECIIAEGNEKHRALLFHEVKDEIVLLSKSKYAKYFVMKMLKYGSKEQKEAIMKAFEGTVPQLMKHTDAAQVVETAFNECANAQQRYSMVQEFYGVNYRLFKEPEIHSLEALLKNKPEIKPSIIKSMQEELLKVLEKSVVKHSLIHHVLLQFFLNCDPASRSEIIQSMREIVPEILHTKDGSRVAMHCVWYGTYLDRKVIIKHMKTFVKKIAMEEFGHMVLLALFDCVDDTLLIEKVIIKELQQSLLEVSQSVHGKKVLVYLLNPRDPQFFHPDIVNILKVGDDNKNSKKNPAVRQEELKKAIAKPLTDMIISNISESYKNNAFCLLTVTILKHTVGDKADAFKAIAEIVAEPYTSENKNIHAIENHGYMFMLKHLIRNDAQEKAKHSITFSEVLVNTVPQGVMKTWFQCNRGAFILVNLLETEITEVVNRIKEELTGCKKKLENFKFVGAELLLKKLKSL